MSFNKLVLGPLVALSLAGPALAAPPAALTVDPEALAAMAKMSAYLRTLTSFEVKSEATDEVVIDDAGAKLSFTSSNVYRVRRPDAFYVETASDRRVRRFFYDGRTLTVSAPRAGFFAQAAAPPTILKTLEEAYADFGIALPLADLFYWGADDAPSGQIKRAMKAGYARVDGADTDQYLFRSPTLEWQVWIERGPAPLPRKVVITTLDDPARPSYAASLTWNTKVSFGADTFAFKATSGDKPVALARIGQ